MRPCQGRSRGFNSRFPLHKAAWPSGKATACKAVILRFKSGSRLQKNLKWLRIISNAFNTLSGNNSVVECDLAKVEVAGSNPVSRSTRRLSQGVRRRPAKPLFPGSNPGAASNPDFKGSEDFFLLSPFFIWALPKRWSGKIYQIARLNFFL